MCFSMLWLRDILVWAVCIIAVIAIIKIVVPFVMAKLGGDGGVIVQIVNIALWAFVAIAVIYIAFAIISCLLGSGGLMPPRLR